LFRFSQRYIEINPVRAGIVKHAGEYRWSSYKINGLGNKSFLIRPHSLYRKLGRTDAPAMAYRRELFRYELESKEIDKIRKPLMEILPSATIGLQTK